MIGILIGIISGAIGFVAGAFTVIVKIADAMDGDREED